jgi:hypothetical protein
MDFGRVELGVVGIGVSWVTEVIETVLGWKE